MQLNNTIDTSMITTPSSVRDFFELLKPRVMTLVVFTGFAGMWIAPGFGEANPFVMLLALLALAVGAGAAGAFNMWFDRDIDQLMTRTKDRPVAAGRIHPDDALFFALWMSGLSVILLGMATNWVAAGILAFANIFYSVIYTMILKRNTPQNIVIGGAAGAFPPMIGWAAVTGDVTLMPILLFAIIFLWTPPHFWALCLFADRDFKQANLPMLPFTHGVRRTKIEMLVYTIILAKVTLLPWILGLTGLPYGLSALLLSSGFIYAAIRVLNTNDLAAARRMFGYSVFYLFALFAALMIDHGIG